MSSTDWLFALEFGGAFIGLMLFGWWQLRSMDREEEREKQEEARKLQEAEEEAENKVY